MVDERKKRRRKKARTQDFSSDSSDASGSDSDHSVVVPDIQEIPHLDDIEIDDEDSTTTTTTTTTTTKPVFPPQLQMSSNTTDDEFNKFYMQLLTSEFAQDLDLLRASNDFGQPSLPLLIDALKQGVNIFDPDQRKLLLNGVDALKH